MGDKKYLKEGINESLDRAVDVLDEAINTFDDLYVDFEECDLVDLRSETINSIMNLKQTLQKKKD